MTDWRRGKSGRYECQDPGFQGWYIVREDNDFRAFRGHYWKVYAPEDVPAADGKNLGHAQQEAEKLFEIIRAHRARTAT